MVSTEIASDFLTNVRQRLLERQAELEERRKRLEADRQRKTEALTADADDRAIQQENDEVVDRLLEAVNAELREIGRVLVRLEEGDYGVCETCGAPIGEKRLAAVPYATQCQRCVAQAGS